MGAGAGAAIAIAAGSRARRYCGSGGGATSTVQVPGRGPAVARAGAWVVSTSRTSFQSSPLRWATTASRSSTTAPVAVSSRAR